VAALVRLVAVAVDHLVGVAVAVDVDERQARTVGELRADLLAALVVLAHISLPLSRGRVVTVRCNRR
jgi:hypothetical protein